MECKDTRADRPLLSGRETNEPDDAGMRFAFHDGELTEVLVEGHEHALGCVRLA